MEYFPNFIEIRPAQIAKNFVILDIEARVYRAYIGEINPKEKYLEEFAAKNKDYFDALRSGNTEKAKSLEDSFRESVIEMGKDFNEQILEGLKGKLNSSYSTEALEDFEGETPYFDSFFK